MAINTFVIAKASHQSLDFATALTINVQSDSNLWITLFQLLTVLLLQSQKFRSILSIFQLDNGTNLTEVGNDEPISSTLIKNQNQKSQFHKGVSSNLSFHKEITILSLSSTIQTGLSFQSPSISSSHTFHTQSQSISFWLGLYT